MKQNTTTESWPESLEYEIELEDHGIVTLELVLNRFLNVPPQTPRKSGKRQRPAWTPDVR